MDLDFSRSGLVSIVLCFRVEFSVFNRFLEAEFGTEIEFMEFFLFNFFLLMCFDLLIRWSVRRWLLIEMVCLF